MRSLILLLFLSCVIFCLFEASNATNAPKKHRRNRGSTRTNIRTGLRTSGSRARSGNRSRIPTKSQRTFGTSLSQKHRSQTKKTIGKKRRRTQNPRFKRPKVITRIQNRGPITSKDIRKNVSGKLKTRKGEHVDHIVEMQVVAKAMEPSGIKRGFNMGNTDSLPLTAKGIGGRGKPTITPKRPNINPKGPKATPKGPKIPRGNGKPKILKSLRCRRSIVDGLELGMDQPDIPSNMLPLLPGSFNDLTFSENMPGKTLVDGVLSVFFILQLMKIGHPRSKPYFNEICNSQYPTMSIDDCTKVVSKSLQHYGKIDNNKDVSSEANNFFTDILETLDLEMESFSSNNLLSRIMESASCENLDEETNCHHLFTTLKSGLKKINNWLKSSEIKSRRKRQTLCNIEDEKVKTLNMNKGDLIQKDRFGQDGEFLYRGTTRAEFDRMNGKTKFAPRTSNPGDQLGEGTYMTENIKRAETYANYNDYPIVLKYKVSREGLKDLDVRDATGIGKASLNNDAIKNVVSENGSPIDIIMQRKGSEHGTMNQYAIKTQRAADRLELVEVIQYKKRKANPWPEDQGWCAYLTELCMGKKQKKDPLEKIGVIKVQEKQA